VYYISGGKLVEVSTLSHFNSLALILTFNSMQRCHSQGRRGWYDGKLTGMFPVAHYSQLAVTCRPVGGSEVYLKVYYQDCDNVGRQLCKGRSSEWINGDLLLSMAIPGTSIAVSKPQKIQLATPSGVLFQLDNTQLTEQQSIIAGGTKEGV
jgi:hypothetical protein